MVTNKFVRDEIVKCFTGAHKDFMTKGADNLGYSFSEEETNKRLLSLIKIAFKEANANFDDPSKQDLLNVIEILKKKAKVAGRAPETINKNAANMTDLIKQIR